MSCFGLVEIGVSSTAHEDINKSIREITIYTQRANNQYKDNESHTVAPIKCY